MPNDLFSPPPLPTNRVGVRVMVRVRVRARVGLLPSPRESRMPAGSSNLEFQAFVRPVSLN